MKRLPNEIVAPLSEIFARHGPEYGARIRYASGDVAFRGTVNEVKQSERPVTYGMGDHRSDGRTLPKVATAEVHL